MNVSRRYGILHMIRRVTLSACLFLMLLCQTYRMLDAVKMTARKRLDLVGKMCCIILNWKTTSTLCGCFLSRNRNLEFYSLMSVDLRCYLEV